MPRLSPFRGVRYHPLLFPDLGAVVAPPYDLIGSDERRRLLERHDRNVVRLVLGFEEASELGTPARYAEAARTLAAWLAEGTLVRDARPALYGYAQRFTHPLARSGTSEHVASAGSPLERVGFIGRIQLEPWGQGIHRHERTLAAPKADRLRLMRATRARLDPVFGITSDSEGELSSVVRATRAASDAVTWGDETGIEHALWPIADTEAIEALVAGMVKRDIVIADGHHRYETALAFREECRQIESATGGEGAGDPGVGAADRRAAGRPGSADRRAVGRAGAADYVLMYLTAIEDPSLLILPVHRLLIGVDVDDLDRRLRERFRVEKLSSGPEDLTDLQRNGASIGFLTQGESARLVLHGESAQLAANPPRGGEHAEHPAAIVDREILGGMLGWKAEEAVRSKRLRFATDLREVLAAVKKNEAACAFLLPPTPVSVVADVARAGHTMPQKSTYFYPKIPSGLVFDLIDS